MIIARLHKIAHPFIHIANQLQPLWWLGLRLWIAIIFFKSGLVKIADFETTVVLFADEYKVPLLPPYVAALSGTFFELACPVLLVVGLATRLAVLPLIAMTLVIQFTYLDNIQHYYWLMILSGLLLHGGGKLSVDALVVRKYFTPS